LNIAASATLKIAALAPMPSASVRHATIVNPGLPDEKPERRGGFVVQHRMSPPILFPLLFVHIKNEAFMSSSFMLNLI